MSDLDTAIREAEALVTRLKTLRAHIAGPSEIVAIVAPTLTQANEWMHHNAQAVSGDGNVRVITASHPDRLRGARIDRLIIIGHPSHDLIEHAEICMRGTEGQVVRLDVADRLAAGWRSA